MVAQPHRYTWMASGSKWQFAKKGPNDTEGSICLISDLLTQTLISVLSEWGPERQVVDTEAETQDSLGTSIKGQRVPKTEGDEARIRNSQ